MAEKNWEIFLGLLCDSREATRESGIYKLIIEKYPIQLMQKLISIAVDESSTQREYAAAVIIEMNDANLLEKNYSKIDLQTLDLLRRNAIDLTVDNEVGSALQMCGEQMAFKLVRESLELEQRWDGFLEFTEEGFTSPSSAHLHRFLAIFRGLPSHLRDKLVSIMKPCITRNSAQFEATVLQLLHEAHDETPFLILPCIIRTFNQTISPTFTQGAIMSHLFTNNTSYPSAYMALRVAEILEYCIEHTRPFHFSPDTFYCMEVIICRLALFLESTDATENKEAALRLLEAFVKKFEAYNPPSKCRQPYREE